MLIHMLHCTDPRHRVCVSVVGICLIVNHSLLCCIIVHWWWHYDITVSCLNGQWIVLSTWCSSACGTAVNWNITSELTSVLVLLPLHYFQFHFSLSVSCDHHHPGWTFQQLRFDKEPWKSFWDILITKIVYTQTDIPEYMITMSSRQLINMPVKQKLKYDNYFYSLTDHTYLRES